MRRKQWHIQKHSAWSPEGYWASYSDLMAGILLVFAVASAGSMIMIHKQLVEPTEPLRKWQEFVQGMCTDPSLNTRHSKVDCNTGRLIITEESLRYELNETVLKPEGKAILISIIPNYLDRIRNYEGFEERLKSIEVSGHTDSTGDFDDNVYIGSTRAANVLNFLIAEPQMERHSKLLKDKAFSSGYADTVPPSSTSRVMGSKNWPDARRIEIQIHLDEAGILKELKTMLENFR
ncbi:MAG: OmpA family protein [Acidobacteriota bacterium]|nr:OmpA family protein [Acidobacteriota bacterium]